jgi:choline dehydrogenase-like flavoprotein
MAAESQKSYDIIIIGGGTAGLVLANRLSDLSDLTILVLEAGYNLNSDPKVSIPGFVTQSFGDPKYDWCFETVPQEALGGRVLTQPRGKLLGGSSAINAMSAVYPSRKVFDVWASYGNEGWDAETMVPYLKKWERAHPPPEKTVKELGLESYLDISLSGTDGPVSTAIPKWYLPLCKVWMETMENLGLKTKTDPVAGEPLGAFLNPCYIDPRTGTRSHAGTAYWEPVSSRTNLSLQEGAVVEKIVLQRDDRGELIAKGVEYTIDGVAHVALAQKEIILSAGGFGSPAILEMSGIGNPDILKPLGVEVLLDNPCVGENLQDHPMIFISHEVSDPEDTLDSLRLPGKIEAAMKLYTEQQDGVLANGFSNLAFLSTVAGIDPSNKAGFLALVDKHTADSKLSSAEKIRISYFKSMAISETDASCYVGPAPFARKAEHGSDMFGISMVFSLLHPFSRGSTHIQSTDPSKTPLIDPKYLSHPLDLEILAHHLLSTNTIFATEPFKSLLKPGGRTNVPASMAGSTTGLPETMEQAKAWAVAGTGSQYHVSGTCAMMPKEMGGVVDGRLRVHGVKGLRVCDASIFPVIPKGPCTSSVYAVAERAADLIKEDLRKRSVQV